MVYGKQGGRHPDPGMGVICARCGEPREAHGGPRKMGACPDQSGITSKRFSLRAEDKPERPAELPPPTGSPNRAFRLDDLSLWTTFGLAASLAGMDRSAVLRDFIRWYVGEGELPTRPEQQVPVRED